MELHINTKKVVAEEKFETASQMFESMFEKAEQVESDNDPFDTAITNFFEKVNTLGSEELLKFATPYLAKSVAVDTLTEADQTKPLKKFLVDLISEAVANGE